MFQFQTNIIKRRRINKRALFYGLIFAGLLGYLGMTLIEQGRVPIIEDLVRQIGLLSYLSWFYVGIFALFAFMILPAIRTLFQKKVFLDGYVSFDEEKLEIKKGKEKFVIPGNDLQQLNFELKALPDGTTPKEGELFGGSWMRIPTKRGSFNCELNLDSPKKKEALLEMIEFLKIEHDVKIKVEELKK